jgi:hypothetical protein
MDKNLIRFYPKHKDLSEEDHDKQVMVYRDWLDTHGRYGKLYMMNIGRIEGDSFLTEAEVYRSIINGVNIYDGEIAILFKLKFEV